MKLWLILILTFINVIEYKVLILSIILFNTSMMRSTTKDEGGSMGKGVGLQTTSIRVGFLGKILNYIGFDRVSYIDYCF